MPGATVKRLQQLLAEQASKRPEAPALWWRGEASSYASLQEQVLLLAGRLAATGAPGDRVAILAWNCPEFVQLIYAVPAAGRILLPLNARLAPAELLYQLNSAGVSTLLGDAQLLRPLLAHPEFPPSINTITLGADFQRWLTTGSPAALPATAEDDPVWILYTSGTTGRPKGAVLSHRSFLAGLRSAALARPVQAQDRYLYPFPLFHVAAHNMLLQHQYGASVVLMKSFEAGAVIKACRHMQVSSMSLAPTMIAMLLDHADFRPGDLDTVRSIGYGASAMPQTLLARLLSDTDIELCQSYGMTELSGSVAFLTARDHRLAAGSRPELLKSVGRPLPTASIRLVDDDGTDCGTGHCGEILVQGEQCMQGYWQDSQGTAAALENGWLHTGDMGRFDDSGYLYIVDRKKDMILSGGENIASREVEEVLRGHPAVRDCAVTGLPDATWGEAVCAFVVLCEDTSDPELDEYCRRSLAAFKTPKRWVRIDTLPVNAGGKIDKLRLKKSVLQTLD